MNLVQIEDSSINMKFWREFPSQRTSKFAPDPIVKTKQTTFSKETLPLANRKLFTVNASEQLAFGSGQLNRSLANDWTQNKQPENRESLLPIHRVAK